MVQITVSLTPQLTGVQGKLHMVIGDQIYPVINLPLSENGIISGGIAVSSPELDYAVIIPEQTINGIIYLESMSTLFNLLSNVNLNMILEPKFPPTPPTPPLPPVEYGSIAVPAILGLVVMLAAIRLL